MHLAVLTQVFSRLKVLFTDAFGSPDSGLFPFKSVINWCIWQSWRGIHSVHLLIQLQGNENDDHDGNIQGLDTQ